MINGPFCLVLGGTYQAEDAVRSRVPSTKCSELTTTGLTHVVSCLTTSHTELLSSLDNFAFSPRLRAVRVLARISPSSTQSASSVIDSCIYSISLRSTEAGNVEITRFSASIVTLSGFKIDAEGEEVVASRV